MHATPKNSSLRALMFTQTHSDHRMDTQMILSDFLLRIVEYGDEPSEGIIITVARFMVPMSHVSQLP